MTAPGQPDYPRQSAPPFDAGARILVSVLTPTRNAGGRLAAGVASVRDQTVTAEPSVAPFRIEHIVIDGGSTDGTVAWLRQHGRPLAEAPDPLAAYCLRWVSGADDGMYDALNRGLDAARGDIVGHLNDDEQYLEGALGHVVARFAAQPALDLLSGAFLVVSEAGALLAFRKPVQPRWTFIAADYLYGFTCALFFRRRVFADGLRYDARLRCVADETFVVEALRRGCVAARDGRFLAAFRFSPLTLGRSPAAAAERQRCKRAYPPWVRVLSPALRLLRRAESALTGSLRAPLPIRYRLYAEDGAPARRFEVARATWRWPQG